MIVFQYIFTFLIVSCSSIMFCYADIVVVPPEGQISLPSINEQEPGAAIGAVIAWFIGVTAVLTILAITWAGVQMVLAVGEEEKMKKARYTMIYAFIGLIVSGLAYGAVNFVTNLNLDNFL